jgi:hypothetical protein
MEEGMRRILAVLVCVAAAGGLAAQGTPTAGLSIDVVMHEPSRATLEDVAPYILSIERPHPDAGLPGVPSDAMTGIWGNGRGLKHLPDVTDHFYALAGTTTHDLAFLTNTTGSDINIDVSSFAITNRWAIGDDSGLESVFPDMVAVPEIVPPIDPSGGSQISIPNGAEGVLFMMRTRWRDRLDTSPREYGIEFSFTMNGSTESVHAVLKVPKVSDRETGCTASPNRFPTGLLLLGAGAMAAYVQRRRILGRVV